VRPGRVAKRLRSPTSGGADTPGQAAAVGRVAADANHRDICLAWWPAAAAAAGRRGLGGQSPSTTVFLISTGVASAKPNISEILSGSPVGEWLIVAVSLYRPSWGTGGATWNVYSYDRVPAAPTMGMTAGPELVRRPPAFEKIVLERGDEWAPHTGGTLGLQVSAATVQRTDADDLLAQDHSWLADSGIDWERDDTH
jgi:hypothetical protein